MDIRLLTEQIKLETEALTHAQASLTKHKKNSPERELVEASIREIEERIARYTELLSEAKGGRRRRRAKTVQRRRSTLRRRRQTLRRRRPF
jgi:hypothetical protein